MKKQTPTSSPKVVIVTPPIKDTKGQATASVKGLPSDVEMLEDDMENDDPVDDIE